MLLKGTGRYFKENLNQSRNVRPKYRRNKGINLEIQDFVRLWHIATLNKASYPILTPIYLSVSPRFFNVAEK